MVSSDTMPCGCLGHADYEDLCQHPKALARIRDLEAQLATATHRGDAYASVHAQVQQKGAYLLGAERARDAALEEAARVADECSLFSPRFVSPGAVADDIRALRSQPAARLYSIEEVEAAWKRAREAEPYDTNWSDLRAALEGKKP